MTSNPVMDSDHQSSAIIRTCEDRMHITVMVMWYLRLDLGGTRHPDAAGCLLPTPQGIHLHEFCAENTVEQC